MSEQPALIFVYNADSGFFNLLTDAAHKMLSPETYNCKLCALTHGNFGPKKEWREFVSSLSFSTEFLHADEFTAKYSTERYKLPAIFIRGDEGLAQFVGAEAINNCLTLDDLQALIRKAESNHPGSLSSI